MDTQMPLKDPIKQKEYAKEYNRMNPDKRREWSKKYRLKHRDKLKEYATETREKRRKYMKEYNLKYRTAKHEKLREKDKKYREANLEMVREATRKSREKFRETNNEKERERQTEYMRKRRASDPLFKLTGNIRNNIRTALQRLEEKKSTSTNTYLGCSLNWFVTVWWPSKIQAWNDAYPEHKLDLDSGGIECDHIKPVRAFEAHEMNLCFHFTNLQPLPRAINRLKRDTWREADESFWRSNIIYNADYTNPYLPVDMGNI